MAPAGVAGGAGGAGGADPNAVLTMEAVITEVNKVVEAKMAGALDKFKKEGLAPAIQEQLTPINASLTSINDAIGKLSPNPSPNPNPTPQGGGNPDPQTNVLLKQLQDTTKAQGQQIETLRKEKEEAEKRAETSSRHGTVRQALGNMHFISDAASNTAFTLVEPAVRKLDDGSFVGTINGSDFPIDAFVKDFLTKEHSYLLRASGASGSGAPASPGVRMGVKADLNDIKVGMKSDVRDSIVASIGAALQNA
jgi:hypothetical protein